MLNRNKSITEDRSSRSIDRKKLKVKLRDRMSTFRVNNGLHKARSPYDNPNHGKNTSTTNIETPIAQPCLDTSMSLQLDGLYLGNQIYQQLLLDELLALTPSTAFVPIPSPANTTNIGIPSQTVPTIYPSHTIDPMTSLQVGPVIDINIISQPQTDFTATSMGAFNQTVPAEALQKNQQQNHYHGPTHYFSEPSLFIHTNNNNQTDSFIHQIRSNNNLAESRTISSSPSPMPLQPVSQNKIDQPSHQRHSNMHDMPTRPNPPSFPGGPEYFQASESFRSCFSQVDADDSGFITLEELRAFLQNKDKTSFNDDAVLTIMDMFDNNRDNMIDSSEFPDMLAFFKNWDSCFVFLDADKSGTIDYSEMILAIKSLGFTNLSHKFTLQLLKKYDRAGTRQIDFDNFILACVTLCRCKETYEFMETKFGSTGPGIELEEFISSIIWPAKNR